MKKILLLLPLAFIINVNAQQTKNIKEILEEHNNTFNAKLKAYNLNSKRQIKISDILKKNY